MARRIEQIKEIEKIEKQKKIYYLSLKVKIRTEEIYFKNFQKRGNPYNIKFAYGQDTDPVSMIKTLISYMEKEDISQENGDKIYCVFDADIDSNKQRGINEAIKLASENGIEIIISIPCFELWYRLHYSYTSKVDLSNKEIINDLKKYIPAYEKKYRYI